MRAGALVSGRQRLATDFKNVKSYFGGIRFERKLWEEVELHLAYRWFCRLDLDDKVPDHSTFSVNRHGRFRDSDLFRQIFEAVVRTCMDAGLVKGEAFAVDAQVSNHRVPARKPLSPSAHPHTFRHACGYAVANKAHDTRAIQGWLGHRSITNTEERGASVQVE